MHTYRNPWFKPSHAGDSPEFFRTEAEPVQIGRYQRFHRIKGSKSDRNCFDYVLDGVCFSQRCGACTEAQIDADKYAQDSLMKIFGFAFGPTWADEESVLKQAA